MFWHHASSNTSYMIIQIIYSSMELRFLHKGIEITVELMSQSIALGTIEDSLPDDCLGFWLSLRSRSSFVGERNASPQTLGEESSLDAEKDDRPNLFSIILRRESIRLNKKDVM